MKLLLRKEKSFEDSLLRFLIFTTDKEYHSGS